MGARRFFLGGLSSRSPSFKGLAFGVVRAEHEVVVASQIIRSPRVGAADCREWPTLRCLVNNQVITLWGNPIAEGKSAKSGASLTTRGEPVARILGVKSFRWAALPLHTMYVVSFVEDLSDRKQKTGLIVRFDVSNIR